MHLKKCLPKKYIPKFFFEKIAISKNTFQKLNLSTNTYTQKIAPTKNAF